MHFNYLRIVQIQNEDKTQRDKEALCVAPLASLSLSLSQEETIYRATFRCFFHQKSQKSQLWPTQTQKRKRKKIIEMTRIILNPRKKSLVYIHENRN